MNRKIKYKAIIFIVIAFFLVSCTKEKTEVKLKLKNGDMFEIEESIEKSYTDTLEKINSVKNLKKKVIYSCFVKSIDDRKNVDIIATIKEITISINMKNGDIIEYSSNLNVGENDNIGKTFSYFIDKNFEVILGEDAKVSEVVGIDEIIDMAINNVEFSSLESKETFTKLLFKEFGEENVMKKLNSINCVYNDEPVKVDETWTNEGEMKEIAHFNTKNEYKLESISEENMKITEKTELISNQEQSKLTIKDNLYNFEMFGNRNGEIFMDKETGLIKSSETIFSVQGKVKITSENPDKGAKEYPMAFTLKTSISVKK